MQLTPLLSHLDSPTRHKPPVAVNPFPLIHNYVRDVFTIQTWLLIGAAIQCLLFALPLRPTYQYGPCLLVLAFKITDALLVIFHLKHNTFMDNVIPGKHAALLPNSDGSFTRPDGGFPGGKKVAVFLLNVRSNHPMGIFAPGYKELFIFYRNMVAAMAKNVEETGYLGSKNWQNVEERSSSAEKMTVFYFRDLDSVHKFAHSEAHREGWDWWTKHAKTHPYLGFSHEAYEVPAGNWENIYDQCQPTGLGVVSVPVGNEKSGKKWVRTVVDANRGVLRSHKGRMGGGSGEENVSTYGEDVDPYDV